MGQRLYVGNLPYKTTDGELSELFSRCGTVETVQVMRDQATGRARGFAFVQMATDEDAKRAVEQLHQFQLDGRALVVNEARPRTEGRRTFGSPDMGGPDFSGGHRREPRW